MAVQVNPIAPSLPATTAIQDPAVRQFANAVADALRASNSPEGSVKALVEALEAVGKGSQVSPVFGLNGTPQGVSEIYKSRLYDALKSPVAQIVQREGLGSAEALEVIEDNNTVIVNALNAMWATVGASGVFTEDGKNIVANWTTAQAEKWSQIEAEVLSAGGQTIRAALAEEAQVRANADGSLGAQWTLKTDINGYISGFGFASTANNANPTSEFIIRADKFAVVMPGYGEHVPFAIGDFGPSIFGEGGFSVPIGTIVNAAAQPTSFLESFQSGDLSQWKNHSGSGELSVVSVADSLTGGKVLRIGNNSGNDQAWLIHKQNIPFDPSALYRIKFRVRRTAGTGTVYLGLAGVAADGATWVNNRGTNSTSSQHYVAASGQSPGTGWTEYVGYVKGTAAEGQSGTNPSVTAPLKLHQNVRYIRPLILANYSGVAGIVEVDCCSIELMTDAMSWDVISGAGKPEDGATVGAPAGTLIAGVPAANVASAVTDFNASNNRNSAAITTPSIATGGTAVDHVAQKDGSVDISFEWEWGGNEGDIDGFLVFVRQSASATAYTFGTTPAEETVYTVPANKRAFVLFGVAADKYYTFGVQAYRAVDKAISAAGVIKSTLVKATGSGENPYRPSSTVAFTGDVTGTISGTNASTVVSNASTALTNANAAQTAANTANAALADIAADNKLTPAEKQSIRKEWDTIYAERAGIRAQADSFGITTEKTNYDNAFQALGTYLNGGTAYTIGATPPSWIADANLAVTTTIVGTTFRANWSNLYAVRQALLNKISAEAAKKADWANVTNKTGFASISQITPSNVTTYIANAAIGNAQIGGNLWSTNWNYAGGTGWLLDRSGNFYGNNIYARGDIEASSLKANTAMVGTANIVDLNVTTAKIGNNAVTIPVSAYTEGLIYAYDEWKTVQSVVCDPEGGSVSLVCSAMISVSSNDISTTDGRILSPSGAQVAFASVSHNYLNKTTAIAITGRSTQSGTYSLQIRTNAPVVVVTHRSLIAIGSKK